MTDTTNDDHVDVALSGGERDAIVHTLANSPPAGVDRAELTELITRLETAATMPAPGPRIGDLPLEPIYASDFTAELTEEYDANSQPHYVLTVMDNSADPLVVSAGTDLAEADLICPGCGGVSPLTGDVITKLDKLLTAEGFVRDGDWETIGDRGEGLIASAPLGRPQATHQTAGA